MRNQYDTDDDIVEFTAVINQVRYYNDESTWGVFGFSTSDDIPYYTEGIVDDDDLFGNKRGDKRKFSTLAGKMQELAVGGEYSIKAKVKIDKTYGHQYAPISIYAIVPQDREHQLLFLKAIINTTIAENVLDAYPNVVNDVVSGTLKEIDYSRVKGVREFTWNKIKEKIINNYLISDIIIMLKPLGVTYTMIKKLLSDEPNPVLLKQQIDKNPYHLTRIDNLGFKKVDSLALKLKPELVNSHERLIAYVQHYLTELGESSGHTWVSEKILRKNISNNVLECVDKVDWLLVNSDFLYIDGDKIGLMYYHDIEMEILDLINRKANLQYDGIFTDKQIEAAINAAEWEQEFQYSDEQKQVIRETLKRRVSVITGKAGVGKSSIMRAILKAYHLNNMSITSSALSAMAAQRITEATSYPAMTIHRTLGCKGLNDFIYNKDNHIITSVAFLDEGSMVNANIFLKWLEAIDDNTNIVISGDHKQLPPIGFGNVFSDLIDKLDDSIVSKLTKPMRQAEKSGILVDANMIRENRNPINETLQPKLIHGELKDMFYMFRTNRQSLFDIAIKTFLKTVEDEGVENVAIVVPRRKDCLNSTNELNKTIQNHLLGNVKKEIESFDITFKLGARVMQTVNDYEKNVFNGEIGKIIDIGKTVDDKGKTVECCTVEYQDSSSENGVKRIQYLKNELNVLDLAYALTTHKIQGGARKTIIGIIDNTHYQLLDNCMLYTMLTRAKKRCLLLAEPDAFLKCIRTSHNRRNTWMMLSD